MKSKTTAAVLAIFLGGIGIHKFYLGRSGWGIVYLLFCWTMIPLLVGIIEGIILALGSETDFNAKYNLAYMAATRLAVQNQPISVNIHATDFQGRQQTTTVSAEGWKKFMTTVAGFRHHDGPNVTASLVPGAKLVLLREHTNQHDSNAVKIMLGDAFLGYIPRDDAEKVADALDDDETVTAILKSYNPTEDDYHKVGIEVRRKS